MEQEQLEGTVELAVSLDPSVAQCLLKVSPNMLDMVVCQKA